MSGRSAQRVAGVTVSMLALVMQGDQVAGVLMAVPALVLELFPIMGVGRAGERNSESDQCHQYQRPHSDLPG